jgi:acyl-CoA reductase-like NAD-dependent aldehyde dehydrogenase
LEKGINLGPVIRVESAQEINSQVQDAISKGAKIHIPNELFPIAKEGISFSQ